MGILSTLLLTLCTHFLLTIFSIQQSEPAVEPENDITACNNSGGDTNAFVYFKYQ